jgi:hypothetical protein
MSQRFANKRLNLPNAAEFQDVYSAKIEDLGDGAYTLISYVDAPNQSAVALRVTSVSLGRLVTIVAANRFEDFRTTGVI